MRFQQLSQVHDARLLPLGPDQREEGGVLVAVLQGAEQAQHAGVGGEHQLLAVAVGPEPRPARDARLGLHRRPERGHALVADDD